MSDTFKEGWRQGVRQAIIEVENAATFGTAAEVSFVRQEVSPVLRKLLESSITPDKGVYLNVVPDYGDVMTREEWLDSVENHYFTDYDGHGQAARDGKLDVKFIYPSTAHQLPDDATHVVWFNK